MHYTWSLIVAMAVPFAAASASITSTHGKTITSCRKPGQVALTFDDSPTAISDTILDVLKKEKVHASFFVIGSMAEEYDYSDIIKRMFHDGHMIGSHLYSHPVMQDLSPEQIDRELDETEHAIYKIIGVKPLYVRPSSHFDDEIRVRIEGKECVVIDWNMGPRDIGRIMRGDEHIPDKHDNSFILMQNDGIMDVADALPDIIEKFRKAGYHFVTLDECVGYAPYRGGKGVHGESKHESSTSQSENNKEKEEKDKEESTNGGSAMNNTANNNVGASNNESSNGDGSGSPKTNATTPTGDAQSSASFASKLSIIIPFVMALLL